MNNQLLSDGVYNYEYDGEGNLIQRREIATGEVTSYSWDYRNRLVRVVVTDGNGVETEEINYIYNTLNQRIAKSINDEITSFVYDRSNILLEFTAANSTDNLVLSQRYFYGPRIDQVLAQESSDNTVWVLADHQGTIHDLVDNSVTVINHITYDSFGDVVSESNATVTTRYKYTGREYDSETGLYYYRARYYDAQVGRFIGEDPLSFSSGDVNLYRYVGNDAINKVDPSGNVKIELVQNPLVRIKTKFLVTDGIHWIEIPIDVSVTHAFILVTDDLHSNCGTNQVKPIHQKYYRGGPNIQKFEDQISGGDSGPIVTKFGEYNPGTIDYPKDAAGIKNQIKTVIYNHPGEPADKYHLAFRRILGRIQRGNFKYLILGPNSNTVAHQLLKDAGLPHTLPFGVIPPGWDYDFWLDTSLPKYNPNQDTPYSNLLPSPYLPNINIEIPMSKD